MLAAPAMAPSPSSARRSRATWGAWGIAAALYLVAAALLLRRLGADPPFPDNWEGYTAWRVIAFWEGSPNLPEILRPTDGLMTDSGRGPLVGLPVWLGFAAGGVGLATLRVPVALVAAAAPPLLWLCGRRLAPAPAAALAALLLACSPAWLLYARTATIVGVSLPPLLLTLLALLLALDAPPGASPVRRWLPLALTLPLGIFAYAPVRLLWPLAVAALAVAAWRTPRQRAALAAGALAAALCVPLALGALAWATVADPDPLGAVAGYFRARGEQVLALSPTDYGAYLRPDGAGGPAAAGEGTPALAARLARQNAADLLRLAADRDTRPPRTDYWNAQGQLWPAWVGALTLLGAAVALRRALRWRDGRAALTLWLAAGLTLPLLLTSRVHLGRLLPALPLLLLLAGWGAWRAAAWLAALIGRRRGESAAETARAAALAAAALAAVVAGWQAWQTEPVPTRESAEARALGDLAAEATRAGVTLVFDPALGSEIERVRAATYRLLLDDRFRFDDLDARGEPAGDARLPRLRFGAAQERLAAGTLPRACAARYAVQPEAEPQLRDLLAAACPVAPEVVVLPR